MYVAFLAPRSVQNDFASSLSAMNFDLPVPLGIVAHLWLKFLKGCFSGDSA